jgi:hypothetical protein
VSCAKELDWLFARAVSMPRLALTEIDNIFTEIKMSIDAIDEATKIYFAAIANPDSFIDNDTLLHDMSSSMLPNIVEAKRGHCHEIANVYDRYLSGVVSSWFQNSADLARLKAIFEEIKRADIDLFFGLTQAAEKMRESANHAYRLKLTGQRQAAVDLVRSAGLGLLDIRDKVNDADVEIRKVANKFVKAARVAPL